MGQRLRPLGGEGGQPDGIQANGGASFCEGARIQAYSVGGSMRLTVHTTLAAPSWEPNPQIEAFLEKIRTKTTKAILRTPPLLLNTEEDLFGVVRSLAHIGFLWRFSFELTPGLLTSTGSKDQELHAMASFIGSSGLPINANNHPSLVDYGAVAIHRIGEGFLFSPLVLAAGADHNDDDTWRNPLGASVARTAWALVLPLHS